MLKRYIQLLYKVARFAFPFLLVLFPATMVAGSLLPWAPADAALERYHGERAVMVGWQYRHGTSTSGGGRQVSEHAERTYILIPSVFRDPKLVTVSVDNDGPPQVSEDSGGAFKLPLAFAFLAFGTWWCWFRKPRVPAAAARTAGTSN